MTRRRARPLAALRLQTLWAWLGLVVFVLGFVVLPVLHSVGHRADHAHAAPRAAAPLTVAELTRWMFGEALPSQLPRLRHAGASEAPPSPAELLALARAGELPSDELPPPGGGDDPGGLDHGDHSPLHLCAALVLSQAYVFALAPAPELRPEAPPGLGARFVSVETLDLTQARAPPV